MRFLLTLLPTLTLSARTVPSLQCLVSKYERLHSPHIPSDFALYSYQFLDSAITAVQTMGAFGRDFMDTVGYVRNYMETQLLKRQPNVVVFLRLLAASRLVLFSDPEGASRLLSHRDDMLTEASIKGATRVCENRDLLFENGFVRHPLGYNYPTTKMPCALYVQDLYVGAMMATSVSEEFRFKIESGLASLISLGDDVISVDQQRTNSDITLLESLELVATSFLIQPSNSLAELTTIVEEFFAKARYMDLFAISELPKFQCSQDFPDPSKVVRPSHSIPSSAFKCRRATCDLVLSFTTLADEFLRIDRWNVNIDWSELKAVAHGHEWHTALSKVEGMLELDLSRFEKAMASGSGSDVNQVRNILRLLAAARMASNEKTHPIVENLLRSVSEDSSVHSDWIYQSFTKLCQTRRLSNCYDVRSPYTCHDEAIETSLGWEALGAIYAVHGWDSSHLQAIQRVLIACHEAESIKLEAEEEGELSYYARLRRIAHLALKFNGEDIRSMVVADLVDWKNVHPYKSRCL